MCQAKSFFVFALFFLFSLYNTVNCFEIKSINGSIAGQAAIILSYTADQILEVKGSDLDESYRISLQDKDCGENMETDLYHIPIPVRKVNKDHTSAWLRLSWNHTEYVGVYKVCGTTEKEGNNFPLFWGIYVAVRSMYEYCHKFGANAHAIRDCVKNSGSSVSPKKEVDLTYTNFHNPKYETLYDFEQSSEYHQLEEKQKQFYSKYHYSNDSINEYDYGMVKLPSGIFMMGSDLINARTDPVSGMSSPGEGEYPLRPAKVKSFYMDKTEVTNGQFREFVRKTGYKTDAEEFGWSFVFESLLETNISRYTEYTVTDNPWWHQIKYAYWRQPYGPKTQNKYHLDHPVVHVYI